MATEFKYRAFISYSHADEEWAKWLHRSLETYRLPQHLVGRVTEFGPVPERLVPVFRDRDELATATNLGEILTQALEQSACQLVICSRRSAQSRWVNEEIKTFKRLGKAHRIFAVIVDGEPGSSANPATADQECFPPALIFRVGADGQITEERSEPIAADVRPGKDSKLDVKLKLVAGMLGVGLDELKQREAHRRQRRMMWLVSASVAGMTITSGLAAAAWIARNEADRQRVRAEAEAETARQTTRFMVDLFKVSDPGEARGNTITAREILDKGATRIEKELADQPSIQATLMDTMGTVYTSLGLYNSALPLVMQAYEKRQKLWGHEHPEVAASLNHLGELLRLKSEYPKAEERLQDALRIRRKLFGEKSPEVADTLTTLVEVLSDNGEYAKAEPLIREALGIRQQLYGKKHPAVARSIEDLGMNFYERGEYEQAVTYLRAAAQMEKELYGDNHPALAQATTNLEYALMELGKADEAEPLARLALAMNRRIYGNEHPETATSLNNLGYVLEARHNLNAADAAYREALAINRKLLGENHPLIATNLSNIGFVEVAKGNRAEGIKLLRESLAMSRKVLEPDHPDIATRAISLAHLLTEQGEYAEAGRLVDEGLAIRRKVLRPDHPQVAGALIVKADLLVATKHYKEARDVAVEAQRILAFSLPKDSWQVAAAMNAEGAALAKLGSYGEAERLLVASRPRLAQAPIPGLPELGRKRLVELYSAWGKPELASKIAQGG